MLEPYTSGNIGAAKNDNSGLAGLEIYLVPPKGGEAATVPCRWYAPGAENRALLELQRRVLHRRGSSTIGGIILWTFLFVILQWVMCCILMQLRHLFQGFIMLDCAGISAYILPFWPIWLLAVSAVVRGIPAMINRRMKEVIYLTPLPAGFAVDECTCCSLGDQLPD
jgi:hypothetical protein